MIRGAPSDKALEYALFFANSPFHFGKTQAPPQLANATQASPRVELGCRKRELRVESGDEPDEKALTRQKKLPTRRFFCRVEKNADLSKKNAEWALSLAESALFRLTFRPTRL